jgi:hypothetical protein
MPRPNTVVSGLRPLSTSQKVAIRVLLFVLAIALIAAISIWFDTGLHVHSAVLAS